MKNLTIELTFERSTKNTHLYTTDSSEPVKSLYVQKDSMPEAPQKIRVTVEAIE